MIFHLVIILNIKMNLFYKPYTIQPLKKPHFYYIDNIYHLENSRNKFYKNTCISHLVCYNIVNNDYSLSIRIHHCI